MTPNENQSGQGLAIASLTLGLVGLLSSIILIGAIFALAGAIISIVHLARRLSYRGPAIAGFVLSLIAIVASAGFFVFYAAKAVEGLSAGLAGGSAFKDYIGSPTPDVALKTIDGQEIKLSNLKGKRVLLDFWATWCPPCRKSIPNLVELRKTTSADDLVIIGISDEPPDTIRKFRDKMNINYPLAAQAGDTDLPKPFSQVNSIPTFFIIDANGVIEDSKLGYMPFETLRKLAMREKPSTR